MTMETIIVSMLGGLAPALVAILIAQKQFITQKWWEKKADEYIRVINELTNYQNILFKSREAAWWAGTERELIDRELNEKLKEEDKRTRESVRKIAMAGSILISDEAEKALTKLLNETDEINLYSLYDISVDEIVKEKNMVTDSQAEIKNYYMAIEKTIREIRKCAKKDLGLKKKCWVCKLRSCGLCFWKLCMGNGN